MRDNIKKSLDGSNYLTASNFIIYIKKSYRSNWMDSVTV